MQNALKLHNFLLFLKISAASRQQFPVFHTNCPRFSPLMSKFSAASLSFEKSGKKRASAPPPLGQYPRYAYGQCIYSMLESIDVLKEFKL